MSLSTATRPRRTRGRRLLPDWREPVVRNGLALSLSAVLSSGIGLAFWLLAAHHYPPAVLGEDAVAISALQLVAGISQLNLANAMIRFVPGSGRHRRALVGGSYGIGVVVAALFGLAFVALSPRIASRIHELLATPWLAAFWIVSAVAWAIFVLEDGALTGLRHARWVPIENAGHGLLKAAAVVPLGVLVPKAGILLAWGTATIVTVFVTNLFVFGRALPSEERRAPAGRLDLGEIRRYLPYDYLASLCWLAGTSLLPLFVIHRLGASANAFYSVAWVITYVLYLASINLGASLIVEAVADPKDLEARCRHVAGQLGRLLTPAVAIVCAGAPVLLGLFGSAYAAAGVTTLRLLALSALPFLLTATVISALRVLRRTKLVFAINAVLAGLVAGFTWVGLPRYGILAAGIAWLGAQALVALALAAVLALRRFPLGRLASATSSAAGLAGARLAVGTSLAGAARAVMARRRSSLGRHRASRLTSSLLAELGALGAADPDLAEVTAFELISSDSELLVLRALDRHRTARAVLKVPISPAAERDLRRQADVLARLGGDESLGDWRRLLPRSRLVRGEHVPLFSVEGLLPGIDGLRLIGERPAALEQVVRLSVEAIGGLHERSATTACLDANRSAQVLDPLLETLRRAHPSGRVPERQRRAVEKLEGCLRESLEGRPLRLSWVHGDLTPPNVVFQRDPTSVEAIIDWGQAAEASIAALDVVSFVGSLARLQQRSELGTLFAGLLGHRRWPSEGLFGCAAEAAAQSGLDVRELVLLSWLSSVAGNLEKAEQRYVRNPLWWVGNVEPLIDLAGQLP